MDKRRLVIFFSVFFSLYFAINYYLFIRGYQALEIAPDYRLLYTSIFVVVAAAYIVGRFLERRFLNTITDILMWIGSFWFAFILYFLLAVLSIDLLLLVNHIFLVYSPASAAAYLQLKLDVFLGVVGVTFSVVAAGYVNARNLRIKKLDLRVQKKNEFATSLRIAVASDIHLGTIINRRWTKNIVEKINSLNADLVLLAGDIVDGDVEPVIKQNLGEVLRTIKSKYGIFGITGNHEYIGGVEPAVKYIEEHGIRVLRDESIAVAGLTIIGREDRSAGKNRKTIEELSAGIDRRKPIILMDHQPFKLAEAVSIGTDLQLSGHTHHGQLWPNNFITKKIYELSWGYKLIGSTHFYVSCGAGLWGPPVRIGNTPEIMDITLHFDPA